MKLTEQIVKNQTYRELGGVKSRGVFVFSKNFPLDSYCTADEPWIIVAEGLNDGKKFKKNGESGRRPESKITPFSIQRLIIASG
jgi:hypothetical protein